MNVIQTIFIVIGAIFIIKGIKNLVKGYKIDKLISIFIKNELPKINEEKRK